MTTKTDDQTTLYSIVNDLGANLMIEAGAGTGKTYALVSRVVALVKAGVRMQHIVAIHLHGGGGSPNSRNVSGPVWNSCWTTNTRIMPAIFWPRNLPTGIEPVYAMRSGNWTRPPSRPSTASRPNCMRDRPLPANLPPGWTPMDAVESAQRFEEQWDQMDGPSVGRRR